MNIQEQKVKQLEAAIIMRKAEMWQLTCDMQNIKMGIAFQSQQSIKNVTIIMSKI